MHYTARAAPFNPLTINAIHGAGGVYVIGLKSNQAHLYRHCLCRALINQVAYERTDVAQRGHGRIDQRSYDHSLGEYFLSHKQMNSPPKGSIYSTNEGNLTNYPKAVQQYIAQCQSRNYSARYIGSLVADFRRNLLKGGIYLYPPTPKSPAGKLRLLYECFPLAFIAEQAGGLASDGFGAILDIEPTSPHQRSPLYIGAREMVEEVLK